MQASPDYRDQEILHHFASRADALCSMLATGREISTKSYSIEQQINVLLDLGYSKSEVSEVFMTCNLARDVPEKALPSDLTITQYNPANPTQRSTRGLIQADAFSGAEAPDDLVAWHLRNVDRMQMYSDNNIDFLLSTKDGESLAFASMQLDYKNLIAEIEPVGTRTKAQRQGFARSLLLHCLSYLRGQGIKTVYIRTDVNNRPVISAYESVGFEGKGPSIHLSTKDKNHV